MVNAKYEAGKIRISSLIGVLALLYILHKILPIFGYYMPSFIYTGIFSLLFLLLILSAGWGFDQRNTLCLCLIFSVSVLGLVRPALSGSMHNMVIYVYGELQILLYGLIGLWCCKHPNDKEVKRFFGVIIAGYILTAVTTFWGCTMFPQAARYLATVSSADILYQKYVSYNIGGFSFVYEIVLLLPLLIYAIKERVINRIIGVLLLVLACATIISAEYTTALLFFAVTLILFFIKRLTAKKIWFFVIVCAVIALMGGTLLANLFEWLSNTVENEEFASRFEFLANLLSGQSLSDTSVSGLERLELYQISWDAFWESSLLGGWNRLPLGGHSFVLDTLGNYGILGGICLLFMNYGIYSICLRPYKKEEFYPYFLWIYIMALFMAIINPKTYLFIFICMLPLFARMMRKNSKGKEAKT